MFPSGTAWFSSYFEFCWDCSRFTSKSNTCASSATCLFLSSQVRYFVMSLQQFWHCLWMARSILCLYCLQFWSRRSLVHSCKFLQVRLQPLGSVSGTHEENCFQKQRHQYWLAWPWERKLLHNVDKSFIIETSLVHHSYRLVELSIYRTELAGRLSKVL